MSMIDRNSNTWPKLGCFKCKAKVLVYPYNKGVCSKCIKQMGISAKGDWLGDWFSLED